MSAIKTNKEDLTDAVLHMKVLKGYKEVLELLECYMFDLVK